MSEVADAVAAAEAALKAATSAKGLSDSLAITAKNPMAAIADVKSQAAAASKAATAAAAAGTTAVMAAAKAAATVVVQPAKANASSAVAAALVANGKATEAAQAVEKANAQAAAAADLAAAQTAAASVAAETANAAAAVTDVAGQVSIAATEAATPSLPVTGPRDETLLAALRAQITGGAIFFNGAARIVPNQDATAATIQSSQFSQAALYLAFEAQPRLWSADPGKCMTPDCKQSRATAAEARGYHRLYVDPFVSVRLTTIPVAGQTSQVATPIAVPTEQFLQSQKAAQLQLGTMAGLNFGAFAVDQTRFHWGFGPVGRFMFQNVTDSQRTLRVWDLDNDLFKLRSLGLRLTLFEKDREVGGNVREGWAPAAYLDVSKGKFENFETAVGTTDAAKACLANPTKCLAGTPPPSSEYQKQNEMRWYIEGRVFLQYLYLGFDLNTGPGADDLRFIGGLTVKLDTFFKRQQ